MKYIRQLCTNRFPGCDKKNEGNLTINTEEAEIIRRILREYPEGRNYYETGKGINADGIKPATGNEV